MYPSLMRVNDISHWFKKIVVAWSHTEIVDTFISLYSHERYLEILLKYVTLSKL